MAATKLFTWGGLRGGLALALALSLPDSPEKPLIINMTFGVVAVSILIQGSTIGKLFSPDYLKGILR
jgi:CPA1 family monovalent cation:H+ antiporter